MNNRARLDAYQAALLKLPEAERAQIVDLAQQLIQSLKRRRQVTHIGFAGALEILAQAGMAINKKEGKQHENQKE